MKRTKVISALLSITMLISTLSPLASAADIGDNSSADIYVSGDITMYGVEDSEKLYNFSINTRTSSGEFAVVYSDAPDYLYNYRFDLPVTTEDTSTVAFWDSLATFCFENEASWDTIYIPDAVTVVEESTPQITPWSTSDDREFFENYLEDRYGAEHTGRSISNQSKGGVTLQLKSTLEFIVAKDYTYALAQTMSVTSFITGVLGLAASGGILSAIGVITGAAGILLSGTKVYEYSVLAHWYHYVTIDDSGYPYSIAEKYIGYTGYVYSETGTQSVDTASMFTEYIPDQFTFNSNSTMLNDAYQTYLDVGWREGTWE